MLTTAIKKFAGWIHADVQDAIYELDVVAGTVAPRLPGCRRLSSDDTSLLQTNFKAEKTSEFLSRLRESAGFICHTNDGIIKGYAWVTGKRRPKEGEFPFFYTITPETDELYIYDVLVRPEFRNQGVATCLMNAVVHFAATHGYVRCFTLHDTKNHAMIKVSEKIGFRRTGIVTFRRMGPWVTRNTSALGKHGQ